MRPIHVTNSDLCYILNTVLKVNLGVISYRGLAVKTQVYNLYSIWKNEEPK